MRHSAYQAQAVNPHRSLLLLPLRKRTAILSYPSYSVKSLQLESALIVSVFCLYSLHEIQVTLGCQSPYQYCKGRNYCRRRAALAAEEQYGKEGPDNSDASSHSHTAVHEGGLGQEAAGEAGLQGSRGGQSASDTDSPALAVLQRRRYRLLLIV